MNNILEKNKEKRTKCEIFTRCMGYIRSSNFFNIGKKSEFKERKYFTESKALNHLTSTKEAKDEK